jgi:hypothetical protein
MTVERMRREEMLLPIIGRLQAQQQTVVVPVDAAFTIPGLYEALE